MTAVVNIYCRVSADPQEDNTNLDEQESVGRQFCIEQGLIVGMVHHEVFLGYQYREREKLELMRQRYREGHIQRLSSVTWTGYLRCHGRCPSSG